MLLFEEIHEMAFEVIWLERKGPMEFEGISIGGTAASETMQKLTEAIKYGSAHSIGEAAFFLSTGHHRLLRCCSEIQLPQDWLRALLRRFPDRKDSDQVKLNVLNILVYYNGCEVVEAKENVILTWPWRSAVEQLHGDGEEKICPEEVNYPDELRRTVEVKAVPSVQDWCLLAANWLGAMSLNYELGDIAEYPFMTRHQWEECQFDDFTQVHQKDDQQQTEQVADVFDLTESLKWWPREVWQLAMGRRKALGRAKSKSVFNILTDLKLSAFLDSDLKLLLQVLSGHVPMFAMKLDKDDLDSDHCFGKVAPTVPRRRCLSIHHNTLCGGCAARKTPLMKLNRDSKYSTKSQLLKCA